MSEFNTRVSVESLIEQRDTQSLHDEIYGLQQEKEFLQSQLADLRLALRRRDIEPESIYLKEAI